MNAVVLVPVLARPHRALPLAESLRSTADCPLVFLCSPGDTEQIAACEEVEERFDDVDVVVVPWVPGPGDFARKTNHGYRLTEQEWIFCGADDLVFHHGWLPAALTVADRTGAGVIGTQDLGNPNVKRGIHATHPLVRRSYIEQQGGTFDGTGEIYCELFDHQFVDNELVETARRRQQWAFAKRAVVEHLHPHWGKSATDATYEKAVRATKADRDLYVHRMRQLQAIERRRVRA